MRCRILLCEDVPHQNYGLSHARLPNKARDAYRVIRNHESYDFVTKKREKHIHEQCYHRFFALFLGGEVDRHTLFLHILAQGNTRYMGLCENSMPPAVDSNFYSQFMPVKGMGISR